MRRWMMGVVLLSSGAWAYWADNHRALNAQVACAGRPWLADGFQRGGKPVTTVSEYVRAVLYLTDPGKCETGNTLIYYPRESSREA